MYVHKKKRSKKDVVYSSKRRMVSEKEKKYIREDDNDDEEEEHENSLLPLLNLQQSETVYRTNNHIYFRTDITISSISKLIKLINEANNEFALLEASIQHAQLIPKPLYLHITSFGGILFAGFMGMDVIESSRVPIYTIVEGIAASAATILSLAGKKRLMSKNAYYLIHQLSSTAMGNFRQLADDQTNNEELMKRLKKLYTEKTNGVLKGKKLDDVLGHDLYWGYDLCKRFGLIDGVYSSDQLKVYDDDFIRIDSSDSVNE
jgi:ATP-dependent protease ClpP protease subunit